MLKVLQSSKYSLFTPSSLVAGQQSSAFQFSRESKAVCFLTSIKLKIARRRFLIWWSSLLEVKQSLIEMECSNFLKIVDLWQKENRPTL